MKYAKLTRTDLLPSVLCLGTPEYGSSISREDSFVLMDAFLNAGGNFLDTAHIYADWQCETRGMSEITIGEWVASRSCRDRIIVATKGGSYTAEDPTPRLRKDQITGDLKLGLARLAMDYVDIYWCHRDDPNRPVEEILETLEGLKSDGVMRWYAASNWSWQRLKEARAYADRMGYTGFVASQIQWSLADLNPEGVMDPTQAVMDDETLAYHAESGLPQVPYTSQASGFFSGKYVRDDPNSGRPHIHTNYGSDKNWGRLDRVLELAHHFGCTPNQIALAYLIGQTFPVYPIVGCRSVNQLLDSCGAADIHLNQEQVQYLAGSE